MHFLAEKFSMKMMLFEGTSFLLADRQSFWPLIETDNNCTITISTAKFAMDFVACAFHIMILNDMISR